VGNLKVSFPVVCSADRPRNSRCSLVVTFLYDHFTSCRFGPNWYHRPGPGRWINHKSIRSLLAVLFFHPLPPFLVVGTVVVEADEKELIVPTGFVRHTPFLQSRSTMRTVLRDVCHFIFRLPTIQNRFCAFPLPNCSRVAKQDPSATVNPSRFIYDFITNDRIAQPFASRSQPDILRLRVQPQTGTGPSDAKTHAREPENPDHLLQISSRQDWRLSDTLWFSRRLPLCTPKLLARCT